MLTISRRYLQVQNAPPSTTPRGQHFSIIFKKVFSLIRRSFTKIKLNVDIFKPQCNKQRFNHFCYLHINNTILALFSTYIWVSFNVFFLTIRAWERFRVLEGVKTLLFLSASHSASLSLAFIVQ